MTKLSEEELKEFKETHSLLNQAAVELGLLEMEYFTTQEYLNSLTEIKSTLLSKVKELNTKKQDLSSKLGDKYGDKQVDLESGELK